MALWSPDELPLTLWLKADAISGLSNGDPVEIWPDSSGNGHNFSQGTAESRPLYITNGPNNLPIVRFDGIDDFLDRTGVNLTQPCSIFFILKTPADTTPDQRPYYGSGNTKIARFHFGAPNRAYLYAGASLLYSNGGLTTNTWQQHAHIYDGASSRGAIDGSNGSTGNAGSNSTTTTLSIGSASDKADMDLGEFILFPSALSLSDQRLVEGYLAHKFSIAASLPIDHPHRVHPPGYEEPPAPIIARWGTPRWGEEGWGETTGGAAHVLEANVGAVMQATASRLGANHPLDARVVLFGRAVGAGAGPAPIHPMRAVAVAALGLGNLPQLSFAHFLDATVAAALVAAPTNLRMSHKLAAGAIAELLGAATNLRISHQLGATIVLTLDGSALDLDLSHPMSATAIAALIGSARYRVEIPAITPIALLDASNPDTYVAGSINLAINSSVEVSLQGWYGENGAVLTRIAGPAWDGLYSVRVETPGIISTERVAIRSFEDLFIDPIGGSLAWGEAFAAAPLPILLRAWVRATYLDGTVEGEVATGILVDGTGLHGSWTPILAPAIDLDPERTLLYVDLMLSPDAPVGASIWWVDGATIEYDPWLFGPSGVPLSVGPVIIEDD